LNGGKQYGRFVVALFDGYSYRNTGACCFGRFGVLKMSKDISTFYTKERNIKCGRKGYYAYKREKVDVISPSNYGMFLSTLKGRKHNG